MVEVDLRTEIKKGQFAFSKKEEYPVVRELDVEPQIARVLADIKRIAREPNPPPFVKLYNPAATPEVQQIVRHTPCHKPGVRDGR